MQNKPEIETGASFSFTKEERLCSQKAIEKLFAEGESFLSFPIKVVYLKTELNATFPVQAAFSVSKKSFKRAVRRNRLKRLMREAYRLHKNEFYPKLGDQQLAVFFIYIGKEMTNYAAIENAMKKALKRIAKQLQDQSAQNAQ
ncbi:ribonuclease P protein component [Maribellus sp. YY47]|uniref:ribonuclease P protein component n=1 Tax=Maribellus sp. YY47 TaxID=2929486 RepID=UPI0020018880|nr:ribonuclease P protein component [Maribellus sp. YY47]MCK3682485.1 ribonuclease P protein component [Maribellus sp. YY47]